MVSVPMLLENALMTPFGPDPLVLSNVRVKLPPWKMATLLGLLKSISPMVNDWSRVGEFVITPLNTATSPVGLLSPGTLPPLQFWGLLHAKTPPGPEVGVQMDVVSRVRSSSSSTMSQRDFRGSEDCRCPRRPMPPCRRTFCTNLRQDERNMV